MSSRKLRLPENVLIVVAVGASLFALISGGVAVSQATGGAGWRNADWTWFLGCVGVIAACAALRWCGLFDWITEAEAVKLQKEELRAEIDKELGEESDLGLAVEKHVRRRKRMFWLIIAATVFQFLVQFGGDRFLDMSAPMPNGDTGATLCGLTFGYFHILGRSTTGVELMIVGLMVAILVPILRAGFARLAKANRPG